MIQNIKEFLNRGPVGRLFHLIFYTHTLSGIFTCLGLYVIFLAGAYSFFKDEMFLWEDPRTRSIDVKNYRYDNAFQKLLEKRPDIISHEGVQLTIPQKNYPYLRAFVKVPKRDSLGEIMYTEEGGHNKG